MNKNFTEYKYDFKQLVKEFISRKDQKNTNVGLQKLPLTLRFLVHDK